MRYLFLSNFYPPHALGGYEQWCQEVADELAARGHEVQVLTALVADDVKHGNCDNISDVKPNNRSVVHRKLHTELKGGLWQTIVRLTTKRKQLEIENLEIVRQVIDEFQPDAAMIWGMWNIPRSVPAMVESILPGRVAYYICDYWLSLPSAYVQRWQEDARRGVWQIAKQILGIPFLRQLQNELPIGLVLEHPICVSRAVRNILVADGVPVGHAQVLYGGTQVEAFVQAAAHADKIPSFPWPSFSQMEQKRPRDEVATVNPHEINNTARPLRLVYAGRLLADKGVHTILQALAKGKPINEKVTNERSLTLDIFGSGEEGYVAYLHSLVREYGLNDVVNFRGLVLREEMPTVLAQYDVFVFASEWQEPFARSVLEAMAAGLTVVGTTTGGTGEILIEDETGLTFPAGNGEALAAQLKRLITEQGLLQRLAICGQQTVQDEFSFERMVNDLEDVLTAIGNYAAKREQNQNDFSAPTLQLASIST